MMQTLVGAPIGGGIVLGRACVLDTALIDVPRYYITSGEVAGEWARLGEGCAAVKAELHFVVKIKSNVCLILMFRLHNFINFSRNRVTSAWKNFHPC